MSTVASTYPIQMFSISFLDHTKPSPVIQVQNIPEVSHHMRRLAGGMLLQPGAHHVVDAVCELGSHRHDIAVSDRQDSISEEEPERGQDIALDSLGFPGINRSYKHCQVRETSILTT